LIKPPLFVLALWALVRRQRAMLAGMLATCFIGVSISVAVYGFSSHVSYLRVLSFISQRGEAYYPNQSVNGMLNRWLANGDNLKFQKFEFPPPNAVVSRATITAAATATIISPIAWEHHYGVWPPILALLVPAVLDLTEARRRVAAALSIAFVLTAQYFSPVQLLADTAWNPLQSYVFFGAVLLIATAYGVMVSAHERVPDRVARPTVP
jgi:alpha-1,2-mannosyltransferase